MDTKAEKYFAWSPYTYCLNNPIIYIDPDGNEVQIYNMHPEQNNAMVMFMKTESGRAYLNQFLKKGETVSFNGYTITGTGNGKYENSRIIFGATKDLPSSTIGRSEANHTDGTLLLSPRKPAEQYVNGGDLGKLQQNQNFEMRVYLNGDLDRTTDQWAETLGHEVFVHSVDDAEKIQQVIDALNIGVSVEDLFKLGGILNDAGTSAEADHKKLNGGQNKDYNEYMEEIEEKKK